MDTKFKKGQVPWNKGKLPTNGICSTCNKNKVTKYDLYNCRDCNNKRQKEWRIKNAVSYRLSLKKGRLKLRLEVLTNYGGNPPKCACCNEGKYQFLTLDHKNNDGNLHRNKVGTGLRVYYWVRINNYPTGFQVLCFNCNQAKAIYGTCPHITNEAL